MFAVMFTDGENVEMVTVADQASAETVARLAGPSAMIFPIVKVQETKIPEKKEK